MLIGFTAVCGLENAALVAAQSPNPFATRVVSYDPAPGQFVNETPFNDPTRALGPPRGAGISTPDNTSAVTLGAFGGSITLAFDHTVEDHPLNPFDMDAIVYSNAFWPGGDPEAHWAEVATIEISLDDNGNELADDTWYLIPGSHIDVNGDAILIITWDDNIADLTYPPDLANWIPNGLSGIWETQGYDVPIDIFGTTVVRNPSADAGVEGIFGYAEYSPTLVLGDLDADGVVDDAAMTPEAFYTAPDDPLTVGMSPGAGGGDAFDIAWAVDTASGEPANLRGFDFIRITSAVAVLSGPLGEKSAEIDAVADAALDPFGDADDDGDIDLRDVAVMQSCFDSTGATSGGANCERLDRDEDGIVTDTDVRAFVSRMMGPLR